MKTLIRHKTEDGEVVFYKVTATYICIMLTVIAALLLVLGIT